MKRFSYLAVLTLAFILVGSGCLQKDKIEGNLAEPDINVPITNDSAKNNSLPEVNNMQSYNFPGQLSDDEILNKKIRLATEKGDIVFETFGETSPLTVSNFIYLTKEGYFDGLTFHRREEGFVIQGGDPNGNGTGGPGYRFKDELDDQYKYDRGIVAMANSGPNTNGSQFFIMLDSVPLPKSYTIFGRVIEGMDVVDAIAIGDKMTKVTVE